MLDFTTRYPVNPVFTGLVCSTEPDQMLIGRQVVRSFPVQGSAYKGQVVVKSHVGKMGNSAPTLRAPGAPISATVNGSDPTLVSYESRCYAAKTDDIANEEIERNQLPYDILEDEMDSVVRKLDIDDEVRIAAKLFGTSIWTAEPTLSSLSVSGGKWSTTATARGESDLSIIRRTYETQAHGRPLDTCVIGAEPFEAFCRNYEARGAIVVTSGAAGVLKPLTENEGKAAIAARLGISADRVFVGRARRNTAGPLATHSESDIWGDFLWVGNLLGGSARQVQGNRLRMRGEAVAMINVDEISMLLQGMSGVSGFSAPPGRSFIAGYKDYDPIDGGKTVGWAQHYTDHAVLAADLGLLVQDLV